MYIFTFVLIGVFLFNMFRNTNLKNKIIFQTVVTLFIYIFVNRGYFIKSDLLNIDNWQAALLMEFILLLVNRKISKISKSFLVFFVCLLISVVTLLAFPAINAHVVGAAGEYEYYMSGLMQYGVPTFTKFTIFFFVLAVIQALVFDSVYFELKGDINSVRAIIKMLSKFCIFILIFGSIEAITKDVFNSNIFTEVLVVVLGEGTSSFNDLIIRGSFYMLTGLNRECSHFVYALGIAVVVLFTDFVDTHRKSRLIYVVLAMILILLSGAFSMIMVILILLALFSIYYVNNNESLFTKNVKKVFLVSLVIFAVFIGITCISFVFSSDSYISERMSDTITYLSIIFTKDASYYVGLPSIRSSLVRMYSVWHTLINWTQRPLFGLGIATTYCHGPSALTLSEIGVVGIASYLYFYYRRFITNVEAKKSTIMIVAIWFVANFFFGYQTRLYISVDCIIILLCMSILQDKKKTDNLIGKNIDLNSVDKTNLNEIHY